MKRLFTFIMLVLAFCGNVLAWEPVIKETHWFGMHEYYDSPVVGVTQNLADTYLGHADFHDYTLSPFGDWAEDTNPGSYYSLGHGNLGSYTVNPSTGAGLSPVPTDDSHSSSEFCIGIQVRWQNNYAAYTQTTGRKLPAGRYRLSYDVLNNNNHTWSEENAYFSKFYVQFGETTVTDNNTNWVTTRNVWLNHTIEFELTTNSNITVSFGYGNNKNLGEANTPAVYVSHLKLEPIDDDNESISYIEWENRNSKDYIKSITVVRDWTGHDPLERPKTSFYSWIDHNLRFSVDNKNSWRLDMERNGQNHYNYDGLGLCNGANYDENFYVHNLMAGDQFNIEYYRYDATGTPRLVSGSCDLNVGDAVLGTNYYTVESDGDVCVSIPSKTIIRSVSIIHKNYQKATYDITEVQDGSAKGYKYTLTGAGVLEDKRGAVPYITMRFGSEKDMTFVRNLGDGKFGTASIIDTSDDLKPTDKHLQYCMTYKGNNYDNPYSENEIRDRLEGKEWTTFVAEEDATHQVNPNSGWYDLNGDFYVYGDKFKTILPEYGTYYYFFPEVDGKLSISFYCEGANEGTPFWFKSKNGEVVDQMKGDLSTNGSYYYELKDVQVEKGGVYYLCSNPTVTRMQHPVVRLTSYTFIPTFRVDPLYSVVDNGSQQAHDAATIKGVTIANFTGINGSVFNNDQKITINGDENAPMIKFLGNVTGAKISLRQSGNDIKLDFDNITYKTGDNINRGGAIVVNLDCPAGRATYVLTVAYNAADAKWGKVEGKDTRVAAEEGGVEVKKWDFFSEPLAIGTYVEDDGTRYTTNKNAWLAKSQLFREIHKADGLTADWVNTYVDVENKEEPIFKSVYDMEGDNADMLEETNGLIFLTDANELGIYNENTVSSTDFKDRYIGLIGGGEMWIPNLEAGDRIVLKMGRYGKDSQGADKAHLTITGAQDAIGTDITGDYVIGGSGVATGNDLNNGADITDPSQPWGEYHFISTGGHFKLEVTDATLLKLYSIVIYKHDDTILTENELLGDEGHRQILNTAEFTRADNVQLRMHYRGLNEATNYSADPIAMTGNLQASDVNITDMSSDQSLWYVYSVALPETPADAKFGVFKARQGVQTIGEGYVTDYADCMIPVGYRETMTYPYTWDFTDLKKYVSIKENDVVTDGIDGTTGDELNVADTDLRIWNEWNLRVKPDEWDGNIFVSGGQLYGGKTMFDETRGIGITHDNTNVASMTGTTTDETGGLSIGDGAHGFIVPQVDKNEAIYVRAHKVGSTQKASYEKSDGTTTYAFGNNEQDFAYSATATDGSGDEVFAVMMPSSLTKKVDVKLSFKGYEVKKIAVSTDFKTVNDLGYASESRDHEIDPELMGYMTGTGLTAYTVSEVTYGNNAGDIPSIKLKAVQTENVIASATHHDNNAYIIYNKDEAVNGTKAVKALNGGFHLFVPDMHDKTKMADGITDATDAQKSRLDVSGNGLRAWLPSSPTTEVMYQTYTYATGTNGSITATGAAEGVGEYTTYVLSSKGTNTVTGQTETGVERFRRVKAGTKAGNNKAYLPLLTANVKPKDSTTTAKSMFAIVFVDEEEGSETTSLDGVESMERTYNDGSYYTLGGVKVQNPTKKGIYIKNGKKVVIK